MDWNKGDLSGSLPVKFQFGVEKSVVSQDAFGQDWQIKLNIIPVIPALVKHPLFNHANRPTIMRIDQLLLGTAILWTALASADNAEPCTWGAPNALRATRSRPPTGRAPSTISPCRRRPSPSVLGDFNDASFEQFGVVSRFYRQDGKFMVRTEGPDGALAGLSRSSTPSASSRSSST